MPASLLLHVLEFCLPGNECHGTLASTHLSSGGLVSAQTTAHWPTSLSPVGRSLVILPKLVLLGYEDG